MLVSLDPISEGPSIKCHFLRAIWLLSLFHSIVSEQPSLICHQSDLCVPGKVANKDKQQLELPGAPLTSLDPASLMEPCLNLLLCFLLH